MATGATPTFESAKAFMMKDTDGSNLYDHMTQTLLRVLNEQPEDPSKRFSSISNSALQEGFAFKDSDAIAAQKSKHEESARGARRECSTSLISLAGKDNSDDGSSLDDFELLELAGISVGGSQGHQLAWSIQDLTALPEVKSARFWGKILGTSGDYYIAEATPTSVTGYPSSEFDLESAANQSNFYVSSSPGGAWTKLPAVRTSTVDGSRKIKKYLTGKLDAAINSYPKFPGSEADLLRAQIHRIASAATLAPAGWYNVQDEAVVAGEQENVAADALSWVHRHVELAENGRAGAFTTKDEEGEDVVQPHEVNPPLSAMNHGEEDDIFVASTNAAVGTAMARSLNWPGACSVYKNKRCANIYVGNGLKYSSTPYSPPSPPEVLGQKDDDDFVEQDDITADPDAVQTEEGAE